MRIDNSLVMFEAPQSNCTTDNRCGQYDPWSYDLLGRNSNDKAPLEDEEANNSMVNDLVAKILDEDPIISEEAYANRFNGNDPPIASSDAQSSRMLKGRNGVELSSNYHHHADELAISGIYDPYNKSCSSRIRNTLDDHREFVNMCSGLKNMTLNECLAQTAICQGNNEDYSDSMTIVAPDNLASHLMEQQRVRNESIARNSPRNYVPLSNGLPTSQMNYTIQRPNWSQTQTRSDFPNQLFGNTRNVGNFGNPDMNLNTIALNDPDLRCNVGDSSNSYSTNQALDYQDSYNSMSKLQQQNYRPGSAMTELGSDSGFISNSPLQHFSPIDNVVQNCYSRNNYEDYGEIRDNSGVNVANLPMRTESYQQQQQQQIYQNDRQMDQNYKAMMERFLSLNDLGLPPTSESCSNDCKLMPNHNQRIEDNSIQIVSCESKNREGEMMNNRGYPRNSTHFPLEQSTKFNYHSNNGYQRYTASNSESLKAIGTNSTHPNPSKRDAANFNYKIDSYQQNDPSFNSGAQLAQHFAHAAMEKNVFEQILKQQQQQQQIQRINSVPAASVLFNARFVRGANPGAVFSSVMPVVQLPVAPINPMSVLFGGLSQRNGARSVRRAGPSSVLHARFEQTFQQFQQLEKERKKCEAALADHFPGKRVSSANNIPTPRLQGNSSRADRLIVDHFQEHARVITLIAKMELLRGATMSERIHKAMENWLETIKYVQECRKKEIEYANMRRKENPECIPINDNKHVLALADSIHQLTKASRMARRGMFNALQSTLLNDKQLEKIIVETSRDAILPVNPSERQSAIGEIGQFQTST